VKNPGSTNVQKHFVHEKLENKKHCEITVNDKPCGECLYISVSVFYGLINCFSPITERFDHNSDHDHIDEVTGVASCPKMRLFASSSADGSIKIWDESNHLLRIITLNAIPSSVCFSSQKGDLLIGIGNHLHRIGYATCEY